MLMKDLVLGLYKKGHSISYITQRVLNSRNKKCFDDFNDSRVFDIKKYHTRRFCREFVETTILNYLKTPIQRDSVSL